MNINYLFKNWAQIGGVSVLFIFWLLFFNSKAAIGSNEWLFWLVLPFYCIHQFEEYVYPGNYKAEINQILSNQVKIDFPLNVKNTFFINTILGTWILFPFFIILGEISIWFPLLVVAVTTFNASLDISVSIRFQKYLPGLMTSIFMNVPLGACILSKVVLDGLMTIFQMILIILLGIIFHWVILFPIFLNFLKNKEKYLIKADPDSS